MCSDAFPDLLPSVCASCPCCLCCLPSGRLVFREGALVTALRAGHWVVLDELNLAPTEVLEALNRLEGGQLPALGSSFIHFGLACSL